MNLNPDQVIQLGGGVAKLKLGSPVAAQKQQKDQAQAGKSMAMLTRHNGLQGSSPTAWRPKAVRPTVKTHKTHTGPRRAKKVVRAWAA